MKRLSEFYLGVGHNIYENVSVDADDLTDLDAYEVFTRYRVLDISDLSKPPRTKEKIEKKSYLFRPEVEVFFMKFDYDDYYYMWSYGTDPLEYSLNDPKYKDLFDSVQANVTGTISPNSVNLPLYKFTFKV